MFVRRLELQQRDARGAVRDLLRGALRGDAHRGPLRRRQRLQQHVAALGAAGVQPQRLPGTERLRGGLRLGGGARCRGLAVRRGLRRRGSGELPRGRLGELLQRHGAGRRSCIPYLLTLLRPLYKKKKSYLK